MGTPTQILSGKVISACEKEGAWQQALLWLQADMRVQGIDTSRGANCFGIPEDPTVEARKLEHH